MGMAFGTAARRLALTGPAEKGDQRAGRNPVPLSRKNCAAVDKHAETPSRAHPGRITGPESTAPGGGKGRWDR